MIKTMDDMIALLPEYQLESLESYIRETTKHSVRLDRDSVNTEVPIGRSKAGGNPDVPKGFEWPRTQEGQLMTFIAQLNMEDVGSQDASGMLPKKGMLWFFMGLDEPAYDIEHRVIWIEEPGVLETMTPSERTIMEEENDVEFVSCELIPSATLQVPTYAYWDEDLVDDVLDDFICFEEEVAALSQEYVGRIQGYPQGQHGDAELEAALKILLGEHYTYSKEDLKKIAAHFEGDTAKAQEEVDNMVMLLELGSDSKIGFQWWDCGYVHWFIRKEDLIHRRFEKTYLSLYSS